MSKIVFTNKKGKITITNRLSYPEAVNERVFNAIATGMFEGFLPISIKQKRKETRLECVVQELIPLNVYFNGIVTKKMFLDFAYEIVLLIKNCEKNMINSNNLDLQNDKIFIEPQSKSVKCIYWPIVNNQRDNPPYLFLKQLPFDLNFNPHEDNEYLDTYKAFFNGINPFSLNSFEKMILKLQGKNTMGNHAPSGSLSGNLSNSSKNEDNMEKQKKSAIEYDPFAETEFHQKQTEDKKNENEKICSKCGKRNKAEANYCCSCGERLEEVLEPEYDVRPNGGTTVLGYSGGTTVLGYDEPDEPTFPILKREQTGDEVSIDKPIFRIGTEQKYCDLFISDNNYISRSHADIITRNERYFIIDRNSTNKTYVDGKVIPVETEVEIFYGTSIRLANEDFTFNI